jgi:DNA polymerase II small subunit/DNA polymerase delta subunit B
MNARDTLRAREVHTSALFLGGKRITAQDLLRDAIASAPAPTRELLVRSQPTQPVSREEFESERIARHEQYEEFRRLLHEARSKPVSRGDDDDDKDDRVTVKRTAHKRGQRHFVAGKRVEASQLQSVDGGKRFIVTRSGTVQEMLQYFADELDALHQGLKADHAASEVADSSAN